jgi:hypothetical protein
MMSEKKLNQLWQAAKSIPAPSAPVTLAGDVVRALQREPALATPNPPTLFEELNARFPRLAVASLVVLGLGVAANLALGPMEATDLGDGSAPVSTQEWLLPASFIE